MTAPLPPLLVLLASLSGLPLLAFWLWVMAQQGSAGLWSWGWAAPLAAALILALLPMALAVLAWLVRLKASWPALVHTVTRWAFLASAVLALAAGITGWVVLFGQAMSPLGGDYRPAVIDPGAGIPLRHDPEGRPLLRIAVSSDPHVDSPRARHEATARILAASQAEHEAGTLDAFLMLGDTVEYGFQTSGWQILLDTFRTHAPTLPLLASMGNHDAVLGGARHWSEALGFPGGSSRPADSLSPSSWYSRTGPLHIIALDLLWGPEGFGPRERAWLTARLDAVPEGEWAIVLSHCFLYSSGYVHEPTGQKWYDHEAMIREIAPLLAGKANLVISGHNHYMEWIERDGTIWTLIGAMGGKSDTEPTFHSQGSQFFRMATPGRLILELGADPKAPAASGLSTDIGTPMTGLTASFVDLDNKVLFQKEIMPRSR